MKKSTKILAAIGGVTVVGGLLLRLYNRKHFSEENYENTDEKAPEEPSEEDIFLEDPVFSEGASMIPLDTTGDGRVDTILMDTRNDGEVDTILLDTNSDGSFDTVLADTTGDGKMDSMISVEEQ